jgi:hypothetical protein
MPLGNIVIVVLRLFAIQMFVQSLSLTFSVAATVAVAGTWPRGYFSYLPAVALFVFAFLEWLLAPAISRLVTRKYDSVVSIGGLSREDLYRFAFVFLGLYFVLVSIAPTLNWLHYFFTISSEAAGPYQQARKSFYDLSRHLITLVAGLVALLQARQCAQKLLRMEQRKRPNHAMQATARRSDAPLTL